MLSSSTKGWSVARPHSISTTAAMERIYLEKTDQTMQSAGGMIVSAEGGGREHFAGIDFNRGLLAMWLGPKADPEVRQGLTTAP